MEHTHSHLLDGEHAGGHCRTHEMHLMHFAALYAVSRVLSRSLAHGETLSEVLRVLADEASLIHGMVAVVEPDSGALVVSAVHGQGAEAGEIRYKPGEGILGLLLEKPRTVILGRVSDEPRFLNRVGIYEQHLPFIAVPVRVGGSVRGVLAVQPDNEDTELLDERAQFVEMVANLIGQAVRLSQEIKEEKETLLEERDLLRRTVRHQFGFDNVVDRKSVV